MRWIGPGAGSCEPTKRWPDKPHNKHDVQWQCRGFGYTGTKRILSRFALMRKCIGLGQAIGNDYERFRALAEGEDV